MFNYRRRRCLFRLLFILLCILRKHYIKLFYQFHSRSLGNVFFGGGVAADNVMNGQNFILLNGLNDTDLLIESNIFIKD